MFDEKLLKELSDLGGQLVTESRPFNRLSTGSIITDLAFQGGIPRGTFSHFYGPEKSGKTMIALMTAIQAVRDGKKVMYIDAENRLDIWAAEKAGLGLPGKDYLLVRPKFAEQAFEYMRWAAKHDYDLCILDSFAILPTLNELEAEFTDNQMMSFARLASKAFRSITHEVSLADLAVMIINQYRMKPVPFGDPRTPTGGWAIRYVSSLSCAFDTPEHQTAKPDEEGEDKKKKKELPRIGMKINGTIVHNLTGPSGAPFEMPIRFYPHKRVYKEYELAVLGRKTHIFLKSDDTPIVNSAGKHYYKGKEIGSNDQLMKMLAVDKAFADEVEQDIRACLL